MSTLSRLEDSELWRQLGTLAGPLIADLHQAERPLTVQELYLRDTLFATGEVVSCCEQMATAVMLLSGYRSQSLPSGRKLTRYHYILFHLENHVLRASMLSDRLLQLLNVIHRLGIPERECKQPVILDNRHVTGTPPVRLLKTLDKLLQPLKQARNVVAHRRALRDSDLESLSAFYTLEHVGNAAATQFDSFVRVETDRLVRDKKRELAQFNDLAFEIVARVFDKLKPIFDKNYAQLPRTGA